MDFSEKFRLNQKFSNLNVKERVLWILGLLIVAFLTASLIYEITFQLSQKREPANATKISELSENAIQTITIDPEGRAWISTFGDQLIVFDGKLWETYDKNHFLSSGKQALSDISFDSKGRAWIGTWGNGLIVFDGENWENYSQHSPSFSGYSVSEIAFDSRNRAWVGTWDTGLNIFDGETWQTYNKENSSLAGFITDISFDSRGRAWIGTSKGVTMFDGENWQTYTTDNSGLVNNEIRVIAVDLQEQVWIGTKNGVSVFDGENWQTYFADNTRPALECIDNILFDIEEKVWIFSYSGFCPNEPGTSSGRVNVFDGNTWKTYDEISLNGIKSITLDPEGRIWFVLWDNSIIISSTDLSNPIFQDESRLFDLFRFLEFDTSIKQIIGFIFLWVMIFSVGLKSHYSLVSTLIPIFSFPIFYYFGFNLDAEDFHIPIGNMILLFIGIYLSVKGIRSSKTTALPIIAVVLNVVMLLLYSGQFLFVATWH